MPSCCRKPRYLLLAKWISAKQHRSSQSLASARDRASWHFPVLEWKVTSWSGLSHQPYWLPLAHRQHGSYPWVSLVGRCLVPPAPPTMYTLLSSSWSVSTALAKYTLQPAWQFLLFLIERSAQRFATQAWSDRRSATTLGHEPGQVLQVAGTNKYQDPSCLLSLWRVVRGSKLMHLDLIHGLFIT